MQNLSDLLGELTSGDPEVQQRAAWRCGRRSEPEVLDALFACLDSPVADLRAAALWALDQRRTLTAAPKFLRALADPAFSVRSAAGWGLVNLGRPVARDVAEIAAQHDRADAREMAWLILERIPADTYATAATPELSRVTMPDGPSARLRYALHDVRNKLVPLVTFSAEAATRLSPSVGAAARIATRRLALAIQRLHMRTAMPAGHDRTGDAVVDERTLYAQFGATLDEVRDLAAIALGEAEFLSAVAHDLAPDVREDLAEANGQARAILATLAQAEAGASHHDDRRGRAPVVLADLVGTYRWMLRMLTTSRGLSTRVVLQGGSASVVVCEALTLERAIDNLVTNAVKYTSRGEVELTLGCVRGGVFARVRDTGRGIPAALRERLFEPEASDAASRAPGSQGVGLSGVARLLRDAGGEIRVQSLEGEGSTFEVWLPTEDG